MKGFQEPILFEPLARGSFSCSILIHSDVLYRKKWPVRGLCTINFRIVQIAKAMELSPPKWPPLLNVHK